MTEKQSSPSGSGSAQSTEMPVSRERLDRISSDLRNFNNDQITKVENFIRETKSSSGR